MSCKLSKHCCKSKTRCCALRLRKNPRKAGDASGTNFAAPHRRRGYTLIELLIVISLMGILAGIMLPSFNPSIHDQLVSAGQIVCSDLAYARDLAVSNNSNYEVTFDLPGDKYVLRHSGANPALDTLPPSPFTESSESGQAQTTMLSELPHLGPDVGLDVVYQNSGSPSLVGTVEFGPLGETIRQNDTVIWLTAGGGASRRYVSLQIDPVTGICSLGAVQSSPPPIAAP